MNNQYSTRLRQRLSLVALFLTLGTLPILGQTPDGSEINKAIPYFFGQIATGLGDPQINPPFIVYSIDLARGQQITISGNVATGSGAIGLALLKPSALTVRSARTEDLAVGCLRCGQRSLSYLVPVPGKYFLVVEFFNSSLTYQVSANTTGTPVALPNPPNAGCLSGRVDYITFSLQRIASGLPDEVSIGGNRACASCTVKAPGYPEIADRLESAVRNNVNVEACYDSGGNIFQIKIIKP